MGHILGGMGHNMETRWLLHICSYPVFHSDIESRFTFSEIEWNYAEQFGVRGGDIFFKKDGSCHFFPLGGAIHRHPILTAALIVSMPWAMLAISTTVGCYQFNGGFQKLTVF